MKYFLSVLIILVINLNSYAQVLSSEALSPKEAPEIDPSLSDRTYESQSNIAFERISIRLKEDLSTILQSLTYESPLVQSTFSNFLNSHNHQLATDVYNYAQGESGFFMIDLFFSTQNETGPIQKNGYTLETVVLSTSTTMRWLETNEILESKTGTSTNGRTTRTNLSTYRGICGLLSATHSMLNTFKCSWRGGNPIKEGESFSTFKLSFMQAVADIAGKSTDGGATLKQDKRIHESSALWDCGNNIVKCGETRTLTMGTLSQLDKDLKEGKDCTLSVGKATTSWLGLYTTYEHGHAMHIKKVGADKKSIIATDTGKQGDFDWSAKFETVPSKPGYGWWRVKDDPEDTIDGPPGKWAEFKHNYAEVMCCEKIPAQVNY